MYAAPVPEPQSLMRARGLRLKLRGIGPKSCFRGLGFRV